MEAFKKPTFPGFNKKLVIGTSRIPKSFCKIVTISGLDVFAAETPGSD